MRRVQLLVVFLTLALATPFTVFALFATAYITNNLTQISNAVVFIGQSLFSMERDLLLEVEVIGMILGTLIIFAIMQSTLLLQNRKNL